MARTGIILMDSNDLWTTYGVFALRGSYDDLIRLPDLKEPSSYSWAAEDGEDVDLTNRVAENRDVTLKFLMKADTMAALNTKRSALFAALKADGWRYVNFVTLNLNLYLYYKSCKAAKYIRGAVPKLELSLEFRLKAV